MTCSSSLLACKLVTLDWSSDHHKLQITLQFTMLYVFKDLMLSSFQETQNCMARAMNCSTLPHLSFSFFTKPTCVSASISYVIYVSAIPTLSFVLLIN